MGSGRRVTVAVALVAAAARLPGVYTHALWEDETASARILSEPTFVGMLRHVARTESTPPLWYALGWLVHQPGVPIRDVRLLSVLAGALLAAAVVDLARRFVPLPLAAAAGLLVALGGELVGHGSELRSYELLALLAALLGRALLAELDRPSRRRAVQLAAIVAAGGLTHFFFAFSVLAALGWLWCDPGARAIRRRATLAILAGGTVASAWGPVMLTQYHQDRFWWIGAFRARYVVAVPLRLFTYAYANTRPGVVLSVLGLLLVLAGVSRLARSSAAGRLVAVLALAPLLEAATVWGAGMRIFALRNLIGTAPFVAVAAVGAVGAVPHRRTALVLAAAPAAVLAGLLVQASNAAVPYDRIAHALVREGWRTSQPVAVFGDFFRYRGPLEWYLPHEPVLDPSRPTDRMCRTLYVIRGDTVRRLRDARPDELRHATILSDPAASPSCVRPIRAGRRAALS
jgi:hypothetical protein